MCAAYCACTHALTAAAVTGPNATAFIRICPPSPRLTCARVARRISITSGSTTRKSLLNSHITTRENPANRPTAALPAPPAADGSTAGLGLAPPPAPPAPAPPSAGTVMVDCRIIMNMSSMRKLKHQLTVGCRWSSHSSYTSCNSCPATRSSSTVRYRLPMGLTSVRGSPAVGGGRGGTT